MIFTSTDDFLCAFSHENVFANFMKFMDGFVPVTAQTGTVLKYLNLRIIQTDYGISYDETQHIKSTIVDKFFPPNMTERLKSADTPYRTDSEFEKALCETLPETAEELHKLEKDYDRTFHSIIGRFLHVQQVTRYDTGFAVTRYAKYASCPNKPAFEGLNRLARYLATHVHSPIMYPAKKLKGYQTIRFEVEPGKFLEHKITNKPCQMVDSDHARDTKTRKSVTCVKALIHGVAVHWIHQKQSCVAAHSTDCLLYTSPSPRDKRQSRMPSSA